MLVFLGLVAAGLALVALALKASLWVLVFVAWPLFWLWMLVDAIVRKQGGYPSKSTNEKILWIVLILFVHVSAVVYWFVVWHAGRNRDAVSAGSPSASEQQVATVPAPRVVARISPPAL